MSIGKAKRKFIDEQKILLPGVGAYNVQHSEFTSTRGKSFTRATRSITQTNQSLHSNQIHLNLLQIRPGPGSYSLELRKKDKIISFPLSKRFSNGKDKGPGPGSYKTEEYSKQKIKAGIICRSARKTINIRQNLPGPGDYGTTDIIFYKKKQPIALFGKAKRNLADDNQKQFYITNKSKQNQEKTELYSLRQDDSMRNKTTFQRAWQGRKLDKQAKLVKKDEIQNHYE